MNLLILGATGGTGAQLTAQALERGHAVMAFLRSPDKLQIRHEKLQIATGDVRDAGQLQQALRGRDAVLSALGWTAAGDAGILDSAARVTVEAMRGAGVRRLIVVSMALLFPDMGPVASVVRLFLRRHMRDAAAMEKAVETSGLDWTVVRPPRLTDGKPAGRYRISEGHGPPAYSIDRADLAAAVLDIAEKSLYIRKTVGVSR